MKILAYKKNFNQNCKPKVFINGYKELSEFKVGERG